ncbi:MAG TPA: superoxide dismutase family protein [Rhizomicrobium sp.]|jgi:Cu-Zn family superoxide dismutase|nr:superoxide dismutase family protein [Rhizomicrobium sp.]
MIKNFSYFSVSFCAVLLIAIHLPAMPATAAQKAKAIARLSSLDGKPVGTADFAALGHGVLITFDLHDLPPGPHGIHLHTSANCDAKSGFTAAGPILSLLPGKKHGYLADGGPEAGDLPNQFAGADGHLHASVVTNSFSLGNGKRSIFDKDGVSVIVDARGDDYRTQPLGNAGNRIACGVVIRTRAPAVWKMTPKS